MPVAEPAPPPRFIHLAQPAADAAAELSQGLLQPQPQVSPKFLYDALGSALFVAITELDEYYPTRTEAALMQAHAAAISAAVQALVPRPFALVDLGAGDGAKAARLFDTLRPGHYVALDIAEDQLRRALHALQQQHPALPMTGVVTDFSRQLALPPGVVDGPSLVFYPGSSIGNFAPDQALRLLRQARDLSDGGALLIGADLVKPQAVLQAAYDDALGVTAAFNLNLLRHVNRLLGSDFDPRDWQHLARFDAQQSRVEMHLQARRDLTLHWPGHERHFAAGQHLHTENAYKWTPASFEALLRDAGWRDVQAWHDDQRWFGVFLARA